MPQLGKLYIDVSLLARQLNFPPDHNIVGMGYDQQNGGYLLIGGPTMPMCNSVQEVSPVTLETQFFGSSFRIPSAMSEVGED